MDPSHKPPNLFSDDSDSDEGYVPRKLDKGKRKAEGVSHADSALTGTETGDSDSMPSPPLMSIGTRPITDGVATVGSDGAESLYHSFDEENDQVCSFNYTVQLRIRSWFDRWI